MKAPRLVLDLYYGEGRLSQPFLRAGSRVLALVPTREEKEEAVAMNEDYEENFGVVAAFPGEAADVLEAIGLCDVDIIVGDLRGIGDGSEADELADILAPWVRDGGHIALRF